MTDDPDSGHRSALERAVADAPTRRAPTVAELEQRVGRRRSRRRGAGALGIVAVAAVAGLAVASLDTGPDPVQIATGSSPGNSTSPTASTDPTDPPSAPTSWRWIDDLDMTARDGSATGYARRASSDSNRLVIFLAGGGICVSKATCENAPGHYTSADFDASVAGEFAEGALLGMDAPTNPFAGWNAAVIPNATADMHGGVDDAATVRGVADPQNLVGRRNVETALRDLRRWLPERIDHIVLAGTGAGGVGAMLNYPAVVEAFADRDVVVDLLVDSAVLPLDAEHFPNCLRDRFAVGWDLTLPDDWSQYVRNDYSQPLGGVYEYLGRKYPEARLGLLTSRADDELRRVLGQGNDECRTPQPIDAPTYRSLLASVEERLNDLSSWRTIIVPGERHGFLDRPGDRIAAANDPIVSEIQAFVRTDAEL